MPKPPYQCICYGYETDRKADIQKHLYKLIKPCPKIFNNIDLTDEINTTKSSLFNSTTRQV